MLGTDYSCKEKASCAVVKGSGGSSLRGDMEQRAEQTRVVCSQWRGSMWKATVTRVCWAGDSQGPI